MKTIFAIFLFSLLFTSALPQTEENKTEEKLIYLVNEAKVETTSNQSIKPDFVVPVNGRVFVQDQIVIIANQVIITAINPNDNKKIWEIVNNPGVISSIEKIENGILFSQAYQVGYPNHTLIKENEINRYKLATGEKLKPLIIEQFENQKIVYIFSKDNYTAILGCEKKDTLNLHEKIISKYSISLFENDSNKLIWQKEFKSEGKSQSVGVKLFYNNQDPLYTKSSINMINITEKDVIICAGFLEDIKCFNILDGKEKWSLKNIWEYQRGFIGPSVWSYYISRFGISDSDQRFLASKASDESANTRKEGIQDKLNNIKNDFQNSKIIGGPIIVNHNIKGIPDHRVFVAISKGDKSYGAYLSECIIYEIDRSGNPISMVNLPNLVNGSNGIHHEGGFIWNLKKNGCAKVSPSTNFNYSILGKKDCISNLEWYWQKSNNIFFDDQINNAWLTWEGANLFNSIGANEILVTHKGGFVEKESSKIFCLPFYHLKIPSGDTKNYILKIPFSGNLNLPSTNYSKHTDDKDAIHTHSSQVINIYIQQFYRIQNKILISIYNDKHESFLLIFTDNGISN